MKIDCGAVNYKMDNTVNYNILWRLSVLFAVLFTIASLPEVVVAQGQQQDGSPVSNSNEVVTEAARAALGANIFDPSTSLVGSKVQRSIAPIGRSVDSDGDAIAFAGTGAGQKKIVASSTFDSLQEVMNSPRLQNVVQGAGGSNIASQITAATAADPIVGASISEAAKISSSAANLQSDNESKMYLLAESLGFDQEKIQAAFNECIQESAQSQVEAKEECFVKAFVKAGEVTFVNYVFDRAIEALENDGLSQGAQNWRNLKEEFLDLYGDYGIEVLEQSKKGQFEIKRYLIAPRKPFGLANKERLFAYQNYMLLYDLFFKYCERTAGVAPGVSLAGGSAGLHCDLTRLDQNFDPSLCSKSAGLVDELTGVHDAFTYFAFEGVPRPTALLHTVYNAIIPDLRVSDAGPGVAPSPAGIYCSDLDRSRWATDAEFNQNPRTGDALKKMSRLKDRIFERLAKLYARAFILRTIITMQEEILSLGTVYNNRQNVREQLNAILRNNVNKDEVFDVDLRQALETTTEDIRSYFVELQKGPTLKNSLEATYS